MFNYFVNFQEFHDTLEYISKIIWYLIVNKNGQIGTAWNFWSKTNFSASAATKYSPNFPTFAQTEVSVCEKSII
jgi:hypothetical protein